MSRRIECFYVGHKKGKRPRCTDDTHAGPFRYDAAYTAWMHNLTAEVGLPAIPVDYGQCQCCLSHVAIPAGKAVAA